MPATRSRQRSAAPCALQKASVVARKDGIARSWLYGRTISAVRGSSRTHGDARRDLLRMR